jgi:hypothetical protein
MHNQLSGPPSLAARYDARSSAATAAILLLVALGAACEEPVGLGRIVATYAARTVNGVPVPAPLLETANFEFLVVADTLRFGAFGRAEWTRVRRTTVAGVAQRVDIARTEYSYQLRGDSLRFAIPCPPDADCVPVPDGAFSADRRHLVLQFYLPDAVVAYERTTP